MLIAIDPGTYESAYVLFEMDETGKYEIKGFDKAKNDTVKRLILAHKPFSFVEAIKSYGNIMGDSIIETAVWIGRFIEVSKGFRLIPRKTIVTELCGNPRANDSNIRQAIIDLYGGKEKAVGTVKRKGPLYGVRKDIWNALAIVVYVSNLTKRYL